MISSQQIHIGLMSGTSADGVDAVVATFRDGAFETVHSDAHVPFNQSLKDEILELQSSQADEIHRLAMLSNRLAETYAECVESALSSSRVPRGSVNSIGSHGQTIRHRPEHGYTIQTGNPALLAEMTGIDVVADFRTRDVAAGGQGAPLAPGFHLSMFGSRCEHSAIVNVGGFANISALLGKDRVMGYDTGPGNALMDAWCANHTGQPYDDEGRWAATGEVNEELLIDMLSEQFFLKVAPKSTGRDYFNSTWLSKRLSNFPGIPAQDVQATLCALTAKTIAAEALKYEGLTEVYVCGGGAYNKTLLRDIRRYISLHRANVRVATTSDLGVPPMQVEALAFAWLAHQFTRRAPANIPSVTGARGPRVLGALYPA